MLCHKLFVSVSLTLVTLHAAAFAQQNANNLLRELQQGSPVATEFDQQELDGLLQQLSGGGGDFQPKPEELDLLKKALENQQLSPEKAKQLLKKNGLELNGRLDGGGQPPKDAMEKLLQHLDKNSNGKSGPQERGKAQQAKQRFEGQGKQDSQGAKKQPKTAGSNDGQPREKPKGSKQRGNSAGDSSDKFNGNQSRKPGGPDPRANSQHKPGPNGKDPGSAGHKPGQNSLGPQSLKYSNMPAKGNHQPLTSGRFPGGPGNGQQFFKSGRK